MFAKVTCANSKYTSERQSWLLGFLFFLLWLASKDWKNLESRDLRTAVFPISDELLTFRLLCEEKIFNLLYGELLCYKKFPIL